MGFCLSPFSKILLNVFCFIPALLSLICRSPFILPLVIRILEIRTRITTHLYIGTFHLETPIVIFYDIGNNMPDWTVDAFLLCHLLRLCDSSKRDFSGGIRFFLFFATILKFLGTSAMRDPDCSAAMV